MYICRFVYAFADFSAPFSLWTGFGHFPLFAPFCPGDEDTRKNRARPLNIGGRGVSVASDHSANCRGSRAVCIEW